MSNSKTVPLENEARRAHLRELMDEHRLHTHETVPEPEPQSNTPISPPLAVAEHVVDQLEKLPDLNHTQRRIALMLARNWEPVDVAVQVGVTAAYVRALSKDKRVQQAIALFKGGAIFDFLDELTCDEILDRAAIRAAEVLMEKMNWALSEDTQIRAAIEILKLTKHYEHEEGAKVTINIDRDRIALYEKARKEAEIQEAAFTVEG